jgi:ferrochelatase
MSKTGILLVNLGSPASPTPGDLRIYLDEFLMDERVLDYPYPIRRAVVSAFILPKRPRSSAEAYRAIWTRDGSPLVAISRELQAAVQARVSAPVALGMRYGAPSMASAIDELLVQGVTSIYMIPLYPHYAMSTFETCTVEARRILAQRGSTATLEVHPAFFADSAYIHALAESMRPHLDGCEHLLFSYHGLPERHLRKTDPTGGHCLHSAGCCAESSPAHSTCYRHQVLTTTHLVADQLGLDESFYSVAFQSRLGMDAWIQPFTTDRLQALARSGVRRLAVACPAFVADCVETLEEIGLRGRDSFLAAGGEELRLVPCLNTQPLWVETVTSWIERATA